MPPVEDLTTCGKTACWLCPVDGYVEANILQANANDPSGLLLIDDPGARDDGTPAWDEAYKERLPEITSFNLITTEESRDRRTSGTKGLKIQACTELEEFGFEMTGILCIDRPIFCYLKPGTCMNLRFHIDNTGTNYWQIAARVGQYTNIDFNIDEGNEVEWSLQLLAFNLAYVIPPDWDSIAVAGGNSTGCVELFGQTRP